jgi:uncharacterized protein
MNQKKPTTSPYIEIKSSKIHSRGIFAKKDIPKGTKIIEYVGERVTKKLSDVRAENTLEKSIENKSNGAVYIFDLNKRYDIDGSVSYNTAGLINHSCNPNCETEGDDKNIWIMAIKEIKQGEELSYNYGYDISNYEEHPCNCGSSNCPGFIIKMELWHKLFKKQKIHLNK